MSTAKNLAAELDTQSDRRAGGVQYLTAKQAARELLRQEQAIAELAAMLETLADDADTFSVSCVYYNDGEHAKKLLQKAYQLVAKHTQKS